VITAYLIGAIPTAVWYGLRFYEVDVRQHGSGNAGATNTFRVLGKKAGSIVLFLDVLKGATATSLAHVLVDVSIIPASQLVPFQLILGMAAVLGHIFPVYLNFKGGKGVATLLGMVLAIHPLVALLCILIFLLVLITTKYVSLSSMLAALSFPFLLLLPPFKTGSPVLLIFGFTMFALLLITHRKNIRRLLGGNENRTYLFSQKNN
jgi:glycerol-3-phosphate acyltransferase PlsY